jgi:hypothetical protein
MRGTDEKENRKSGVKPEKKDYLKDPDNGLDVTLGMRIQSGLKCTLNTEINVRIRYKTRNFLTSSATISCQRLCSTMSVSQRYEKYPDVRKVCLSCGTTSKCRLRCYGLTKKT